MGETVGSVLQGTPLQIREKIQTILEGAQSSTGSSIFDSGGAIAPLSDGAGAPLWQKCSAATALEAKAVAWRYSAAERILAAHTGVDLNLITAAKDRVDERPAFAAALDGDAPMAVLMPTSGSGGGAPALLMPIAVAPTIAPMLAPAPLSLGVLGGGLGALSPLDSLNSAASPPPLDLDLSALGSLGSLGSLGGSSGSGDAGGVSRSTSVGSSDDALNLNQWMSSDASLSAVPAVPEETEPAENQLNLNVLFQQGSPTRRNADGNRALSAKAQAIIDELPDYGFMLQTTFA